MSEKKLTASVREGLERKAKEHNEKVGNVKSKRTNVRTLGAVFDRGVGAYRTNPGSVRPGISGPEQWAYARVNAFLYALRNGRYKGGKFDTDLLPSGHPMSTKKQILKVSYKPTQGMIDEARRGLEWRREGNAGGTAIGVARARDIINGKSLPPRTVLRMFSFFSRHEVDKKAQGFRPGEEGYPSAGRVAWALWGGDAGFSWSRKIRNQLQKGIDMKVTKNEKRIMMALQGQLDALKTYSGTESIQRKLSGVISDLKNMIQEKEHSPGHGKKDEIKKPGGMYGMKKPKRRKTEKKIVEEKGQFCVMNEAGTRNFGCYQKKSDAEQRLAQVERFSNKLKDMTVDDLRETRLLVMASINDQSSSDLVAGYEGITDELEDRGWVPPFYDVTKDVKVEEIQESIDESRSDYVTVEKAESRYTLGPVYVPGLEDAHGETIDANDLQKAIWDWVRSGEREINLQHTEKVAGEMVEILTLPFPMEAMLSVPGEGVTKHTFPKDTPFMGVIWEPWAWEMVKAGDLRGYSIGGLANRIEVELPAEAQVT